MTCFNSPAGEGVPIYTSGLTEQPPHGFNHGSIANVRQGTFNIGRHVQNWPESGHLERLGPCLFRNRPPQTALQSRANEAMMSDWI